MATTIKLNGVDRTVDVDGDSPLLWVLRDLLGMTGTKFGTPALYGEITLKNGRVEQTISIPNRCCA